MINALKPEQGTDTPPPIGRHKVADRFLALIREIVAVLFWTYAVTKLFVFDLDVFVIQKLSPELAWLLNFKFFILIGAIAIAWLFTKNSKILFWTLYVIFYPAIVLLWKVPFFIFRQRSWTLALAFLDGVLSFFRSIKFSFITAAFYLISLAVIFHSTNEKLLSMSVVVLIVLLSAVYIHRVVSLVTPSSLYQLHTKISHSKIMSDFAKNMLSYYAKDSDTKDLQVENLDQNQIEARTTNLQSLVLVNRLFLFSARKLREYENSVLSIFSSIFTIFILAALTIFSFAAVDFGLYKISSDLFAFKTTPTFFSFFYYTFNSLLFNSIPDIVPTATVTQITAMLESLFAFFLVMIFISLLLSVKSQRYVQELNLVIKSLEEQGKEMESHIRDWYSLNTIEDAMSELHKLNTIFADFLYRITKDIT